MNQLEPSTLNLGDFLYLAYGTSLVFRTVDFYQVTSISKCGESCTLTPVYSESVEDDAGYNDKVVPTAAPITFDPVLNNKRIEKRNDGKVRVKVRFDLPNYAYKFEKPVWTNYENQYQRDLINKK